MFGSGRDGPHTVTQNVCSQRAPTCAHWLSTTMLDGCASGTHLRGARDSAEVVDGGTDEGIARRYGRDTVLPLCRRAAGLVDHLQMHTVLITEYLEATPCPDAS